MAINVEVRPHEGEDLTNLLKRFNRKVAKEGFLQDLRDHEYYLKPSDIRKQHLRQLKKQQARELRSKIRNY